MAYNEQSKTTTALITLNEGLLKSRAAEKGLKTAAELLKEVENSFYAFKNTDVDIAGQWIPSTFAIAAGEFSEANQLVNSTLKLVRHKVREYYSERIDLMYSDDEGHRKANLEVLERLL